MSEGRTHVCVREDVCLCEGRTYVHEGKTHVSVKGGCLSVRGRNVSV